MGKNDPLRSEKRKASISSSSTPNAKTYSVSSLPGEPDEAPDADIRRYTAEELREMRRAGLGKTRPDAEEIELDDSFWDNAQMQAPLFPSEDPAPRKVSVHLRVDEDVLDWFRAQGKGHLTRMNAVLRAYFESQRDKKR